MILDGRHLVSASAKLVSFRELRILGSTQRFNDLYL